MDLRAKKVLLERFGGDSVIALATSIGDAPRVRMVNAHYESGRMYVVTDARSAKMRALSINPRCAIAGEWFTAEGAGRSLGAFKAAANAALAERLRRAFADWIDNGHSDLASENCVILEIRLQSSKLFSHGTRFEIDFKEEE